MTLSCLEMSAACVQSSATFGNNAGGVPVDLLSFCPQLLP